MYLLCVLSRVWHIATPWTVARKVPLSMGFSRQEYWSGMPFPAPGYLPDPGMEPTSLESQVALAGEFFTTSATWEAHVVWITIKEQSFLEYPLHSGQIAKLLWRNPMSKVMPFSLYKGGKSNTEQLMNLLGAQSWWESGCWPRSPWPQPLHLTLGSTTSLASQVPKLFYLLNVFFLPLTLERKLKGSSCCWTDEKRQTREIGGSPQDQGLLFPLSWPLVLLWSPGLIPNVAVCCRSQELPEKSQCLGLKNMDACVNILLHLVYNALEFLKLFRWFWHAVEFGNHCQ